MAPGPIAARTGGRIDGAMQSSDEIVLGLALLTRRADPELCLANIDVRPKFIDVGVAGRTLPAMRAVIRAGAAVRSARATRRDLLLETLALRHQLGVLARFEEPLSPS